MFNFNTDEFDFNQILINEHKSRVSYMSLDDLDDNELLNTNTAKRKETELNAFDFQTFLIVNIFQPIGISVKDDNLSYVYKEVYINGETHYLAYIEITQEYKKYNSGRQETKKTIFRIFVDLNIITGELHIGNCSSFKVLHYLNINYPLIKICENYNIGKVHIGDIYVDMGYATKETPKKILDKIEYPLKYLTIKGQQDKNISIYRCQWNGKKYYLPDELSKKELINVNDNVKLSSDFVKHLDGIDNLAEKSSTVLYYKMFDSFEDFSKIVKMFCENNINVYSDLDFYFEKETYHKLLEKFESIIDEKMGKEKKYKTQLSESEEKAKLFFEDILPQTTMEHFESINSKAPNLLSTKTMFKERKTKDPFHKLDLPVIKLILKDNGIDIDKIVDNYEQEWKVNLYKFINIFYKHLKSLKISPNHYRMIVTNIFRYGNTTKVNVYDVNGDTVQFNILDMPIEEIELLRKIMSGLKISAYDNRNNLIIDNGLLDTQDENLIVLCKILLEEFADYEGRFINGYSFHEYNIFILLQRFLYLFYLQFIKDYNTSPLNSTKINIEDINLPEFLFSTGYFEDEWGTSPFRFSDISMKMNTYSQLYKFLEYTSYIIENGYDIKYPYFYGISGHDLIFKHFNLYETFEQLADNEFSTQNPPNVKVLNTDSIIKMFNTIFTNIAKKFNK